MTKAGDMVIRLEDAVAITLDHSNEIQRELLQEIIDDLCDYGRVAHGDRVKILLGSRLLEPIEGIPMVWQFVTYLEQRLEEIH